ncbi:MAG: nucleotidyltransferase domain-containing protein [Sphingomonas bacterium]
MLEPITEEHIAGHGPQDAVSFDGAASVIRDFIETQTEAPLAAAIFGSVARGNNGPNSDIDVLFVSRSPIMTKINALHQDHRIQLIDGSALAIRKKVGEVARSGNAFILDVLLDARLVSGSAALLADLKGPAERIAAAGAPPLKREHYLSIRSRCADALEKLDSTIDRNQRMFVAARVFALLHELAAATNQTWVNMGASAYPQFVALAPEFAPELASLLRLAISQDDYADFSEAIRAFFNRSGEFSWVCLERLRL